MQKPTHFPQDVWDKLTEQEKRCARDGHDWYYDTCSMCGARKNVPDYPSSSKL